MKNWIKNNKLVLFLVVVVVFLLATSNFNSYSLSSSDYGPRNYASAPMAARSGIGGARMEMADSAAYDGETLTAAPAPDQQNRMVISESNLSLVVLDVSQKIREFREHAQSVGGYMVDSQVNRPEEGGNGTLQLRVPAAKLDEVLTHLKGQSVKVVSENLTGTDVTDQFVDNEARLVILEKNKARFEEIMTQATDVAEILKVQREIFSLQSQIDSIKGRQLYLQKTSEMALVTIYLSTDELALPYAPTDAWRPSVIFKLATRSLLGSMQSFGSLMIWLGVYAVLWVPALIVGVYAYRRWWV